MYTTIIISYLIFHIICSVLAYGFTLSFFQNKYNVYGLAKKNGPEDVRLCLLFSIPGPIALLVTIIQSQHVHGLLFRPLKDDKINYGG